jgi:hypothetical protein
LLCHHVLDVCHSDSVVDAVVNHSYFVHNFCCVFGSLLHQKLGSLVTEEVEKYEISDGGDGDEDDPDQPPVVDQVEEACHEHCSHWEPNLHQNRVLLSLFVAHNFSEEEEGNVDTDVRAEAAEEEANSCHVDVEAAGNQDGADHADAPADYDRTTASEIISEERYDQVAHEGSEVGEAAQDVDQRMILAVVLAISR